MNEIVQIAEQAKASRSIAATRDQKIEIIGRVLVEGDRATYVEARSGCMRTWVPKWSVEDNKDGTLTVFAWIARLTGLI